MALSDLLAQLNVVSCDAQGVLGTGLAPCPFDWDRIETAEFSSKNFRYEDAQDLEYVQEQQQLGNLIIVRGYESFTQNTPDPNINTVEGSGFKQVMGEMPTEFSAILNNGVLNWKALRSLNGKDKWNVALYDVNGNKIFTQTKSGAIKGFSLKMLFTGTYKGKEGNNPSNYTQMLQFADYTEMDRMQWIVSDNLDFDPTDLDGVNDVEITIDPVGAGDLVLTFAPYLLDKTHLLMGLTLPNVFVTKNGLQIIPTAIAYNLNINKVSVTISAAVEDDVFTVDLRDSALSGSVAINIAGALYKSDTATVIATA